MWWAMRWRTLRVLVLVFQALWLNVIVPGHRRGVVALPGESCAACERGKVAEGECCEMDGGKQRQEAPKGDPALHCAVCYFAARVTPAEFVDLSLPPLGYLHEVEGVGVESRVGVGVVWTYDGRGPPGDC